MKKLLLFVVIFIAFLSAGTFVGAVEKGGISAASSADTPAVNVVSEQEATLNYKKDIDETFVNYLNNSKIRFKKRAKVSFTVTQYGSVQKVSLLQSTGNVKCDNLVIEMVKTSTFSKFPAEITARSLTFNYSVNNPKKLIAIPTVSQSVSGTSISLSSITPSFKEKLAFLDPAIKVTNFVLNCCFLRYF